MAYIKWIAAIIGWYVTKSFLGAIAGYFIGSLFDNSSSRSWWQSAQEGKSNAAGNPYGDAGSYNKTERQRAQTQQVNANRDNFLYSLMVLSAHIISADGKIMHSEMEFVRSFLRANFDESVVNKCNETLLELFEFKKKNNNSMWQKQILNSCYRLANTMSEEFRQQLIMYLCEISKADGRVDKSEIEALRHIARCMNLDSSVIDQMLNMGGTSLEEAYKVLGITSDATDDEVRKAYKRMAQKHHPDLVSNLGEDVRRAAEKKFQEIGNAKDIIYKSRGMKR